MVRIVVSRFGEVSGGEVDRVVEVMEECYDRLSPHGVTLVDLYVFGRSLSLEAFLAKERLEVGIVSAAFDELFFGMHDAWRGTSRILLCFERMRRLPELIQTGGIRHEVGHSVLHGNILYYLLPLPPALLELMDRFRLPSEYATNLLYLISIAVKDYEVTQLLYSRGYIKDQVAYTKHLLTVSEDDMLSWRMSKGKPLAKIFCLISCLKALGCVAPLLLDEACKEEVERSMRDSLSYLPEAQSASILKVVLEDFPSLGADTLDNISQASVFIVEKLIKPLLRR